MTYTRVQFAGEMTQSQLTSGINPMLSKWVERWGSWNAIRWENTLRYSASINHTKRSTKYWVVRKKVERTCYIYSYLLTSRFYLLYITQVWCYWNKQKIIHWSEFVTNDEIRSRTGQPLLSDTVRSRRLSFFGHYPSRQPLAGSSPSSWGLHYGLSWWLKTEAWSPQTILAQNRGGWPAANESRTSDSKATCPEQIGMAATCGNGYVFDKLLKRERECCWY